MAFEWYKMYKVEENLEREVTDAVYHRVCEHYGVDEVEELTEEQIDEIRAFYNEMNEYSPMCIGFSNLINHWESENWEEE